MFHVLALFWGRGSSKLLCVRFVQFVFGATRQASRHTTLHLTICKFVNYAIAGVTEE